MLSTYSPHRDAGGTLHVHSPSTIQHMDTASAIQDLRRSLSRSPSKLAAEFRSSLSRAHSPASMNTPLTSSPLSPSRRSDCAPRAITPSVTPSHTMPHYLPSSRAGRVGLRRSVQSQNLSRSGRTSPKSPSKRPLRDTPDAGNGLSLSIRKRSSTDAQRDEAQMTAFGDDKENGNMMDFISTPKTSTSRADKRRSGNFGTKSTMASPMKRSEAHFDHVSDFGSPSAKRRSLHGPSSDFSIFESDPSKDDAEKEYGEDIDWPGRYGMPPSISYFKTIPKRSSSLRKSTLQQRQAEKPAVARASIIQFQTVNTSHAQKKGQRISLDNHLPPMQRESPFSSQGSLLNASIHPMVSSQPASQQTSQAVEASQQTPHPLSRTMTQSSSTSSMLDDSPTHEPIHRPDRPRSMFDFSKSLPPGFIRPVDPVDEESQESSQGSFATPANYKSAKPLPAAFMSTGLISKKNRNVNDPDAGLPKAHMPDTPCKKQIQPLLGAAKHMPAMPRAAPRPSRPSFGTPSTPMHSHHSVVRPAPFTFGKGMGIFGASRRGGLLRKASFASIEGEDQSQSQSPTAITSQTSTDSDFPPTPTKHVVADSNDTSRPSTSHSVPAFGSSSGHGSKPVFMSGLASSKSSPLGPLPESVDGDSDSVNVSPSASLRPDPTSTGSPAPSSSLPRSRLVKSFCPTTPTSHKLPDLPPQSAPRSACTKPAVAPVSPSQEDRPRTVPQTPQENMLPPDPSGLSISGQHDKALFHPGTSSASAVPATPTGPRDYFRHASTRNSVNMLSTDLTDVDECLTSRFERVELFGTGEFSQVYKVAAAANNSPAHSVLPLSFTRSSSSRSIAERVFAVKKSRHAYSGAKDRQRKIHEVDVLKALLGHSDHVLSYVDSWEDQGHLYIQTEFCEEGTLDVFLAQTGVRARVDDFRIWKILLELTMGLEHIHNRGFIHLDLKPANVFITFEGVLKIGDFGMAAKWPAKAGIEGEGDREYIGPEILMGRYDKPADIFALGLIMLEIAGNVELPDNGISWQKLRNGDMSDVPSLTWSSEVASQISRDASGNPLSRQGSFMGNGEVSHDAQPLNGNMSMEHSQSSTPPAGKSTNCSRSGELIHPPDFMVDPQHEQALDSVVRWMISPNPNHRPVAVEILHSVGVQWADARRRAGATVFEGNWGPADEILAEDAEMIDA